MIRRFHVLRNDEVIQLGDEFRVLFGHKWETITSENGEYYVGKTNKELICSGSSIQIRRELPELTHMKLVYIAGPFRAHTAWDIEQNIRRAEERSLEVWRRGMAALCPHTNTRFFQGAALDEVWLEGTLEMLRRCDAVLLVPNWRGSSGTRAEITEALRLGIPVFESLTELDRCRQKVEHFVLTNLDGNLEKVFPLTSS